MSMKGLLEWKILAAVFAILIVASSALVGNSGIKDTFLNSTGNIGDWLGGSPFGSIFSTPEKGTVAVAITLKAGSIGLVMESPVNVTAGDAKMENFKGPVSFDFDAGTSSFVLDGSDFTIEKKLEETTITGVSMKELVLEGIDFVVKSENTEITGSGEKIEIYDFAGDIYVNDSVVLTGNVSLVKDGKWSVS